LENFEKGNQETFENRLQLIMGQILSMPFILIGVYLVASKSISKKKVGEKTDI